MSKEREIMFMCSICEWTGFTEEAFHKHKCEEYPTEDKK